MTLVEVMAGTALLGTLLAGIFVSSARLGEMGRRAREKEEACRAADDLLEGWWPKKENLPRNQAGEVPGHPGYLWRTTKTKELKVGSASLDVVAVKVYPAAAPQRRADANEPVGVKIEILLPASPNEATNGTHSG
jgi:hypothetical protein